MSTRRLSDQLARLTSRPREREVVRRDSGSLQVWLNRPLRPHRAPIFRPARSVVLCVGFANRCLIVLSAQGSLFPSKLNRIERKANGAHFVWTIVDSRAYASVPKCLSDAGSQNARSLCP